MGLLAHVIFRRNRGPSPKGRKEWSRMLKLQTYPSVWLEDEVGEEVEDHDGVRNEEVVWRDI